MAEAHRRSTPSAAATGERALVTSDTLRALEREHSDLVASLRALAAVLREEQDDPAALSILARILTSEIDQLAVLSGEMLAASWLEHDHPPPSEANLAEVLLATARRFGRSLTAEARDEVTVRCHPHVLVQMVASALALALRVGDGPVHASVRGRDGQGMVLVRVPIDDPSRPLGRANERLGLLQRMARAEGGRFVLERGDAALTLRLALRAV